LFCFILNFFTIGTNTKFEFLRAQIAAFLGTAVDYLTVIGLTELTGLWYVYSNVFGATLGAITNFLLGRYWAFVSVEDQISMQAFRYALVSGGSLLLNTAGLYLLTEFSPLNYIVSKVLVGIIIAISYNYLLQKYFVFKK
jgi:putative flippase GtrA